MLDRKKDLNSAAVYLLKACDNVAHGHAVLLSNGVFRHTLGQKKHTDLFKATTGKVVVCFDSL